MTVPFITLTEIDTQFDHLMPVRIATAAIVMVRPYNINGAQARVLLAGDNRVNVAEAPEHVVDLATGKRSD